MIINLHPSDGSASDDQLIMTVEKAAEEPVRHGWVYALLRDEVSFFKQVIRLIFRPLRHEIDDILDSMNVDDVAVSHIPIEVKKPSRFRSRKRKAKKESTLGKAVLVNMQLQRRR